MMDLPPGTIGPVQSFPQGLQGLLGFKGQGLPNALSDIIQGVIDQKDAYLLGFQEGISFTGIAPALGSNLFAETIPVGQLWYVWNYSLAGVIGGANANTLAPAYQFNGNLMTLQVHQVFAANDRLRTHSANVPFWAWQDGQFGFHVKSLTGADVISGRALISRIRV